MAARISGVQPAIAEGKTKELFEVVKTKFGTVPNGLQTMAQSPEVLEGFLLMKGALAKGNLPAKSRELVALAVSQANSCEYCLSAHSFTGKLAGLEADAITGARRGKSPDAKIQALLSLTQNILERRGNVSDEQFAAAKAAGITEAEIVEVVGNVAVMTSTNFLNNVARTNVDFPKVPSRV